VKICHAWENLDMQLQARRQSSQYLCSELMLPYLEVLFLCVLFDITSDQCYISRLPLLRLGDFIAFRDVESPVHVVSRYLEG